MKAISLWQPWAHLVAYGAKSFETRSWETSYRGRIAIHASKTWNRELIDLVAEEPFKRFWNTHDVHVFGAIIAVATVKSCIPTSEVISALRFTGGFMFKGRVDQEFKFGDFSPGRFAWELGDVVRLSEPVFCRGYQKIWTLIPEIVNEVQRRLPL